MSKTIKVCIIGLGNCASSLIQGIGYYSSIAYKGQEIIGLINNKIGGYSINDIEIVSAIDVNITKIGKPISEAIFAQPNCTKQFFTGGTFSNKVIAGPVLDGISDRIATIVITHSKKASKEERQDLIVNELIQKKVDVMVSYLPVGSSRAAVFYANCALQAKVAYANAMPEFICSTPERDLKFQRAGVPCAGDDIKSQFGATILHRGLVNLLSKRGLRISDTYQLNIGGNTDFENMLDEDRLESKRISKTEAVTSLVQNNNFNVKIGPSDYIPHLQDNKICYINLNGKQFGDIPFSIDIKLSVEDSPNSAGVMADVIRLLAVSKNNHLSGYQDFSSYYFKHPSHQISDDEAYNLVQDFIQTYSEYE